MLLTDLSLIRITSRAKHNPHNSALRQRFSKSFTIFSIAMVRMWKQKDRRVATIDTHTSDPPAERQDNAPRLPASDELFIARLILAGDLIRKDVNITKYHMREM